MATESNALEREQFIDGLVESVNLDEWVESYFSDDDALTGVANLDDVTADAALHNEYALGYHWMRREVYNAFTEEIWAALWHAADADGERSPLAWLCAYEDDLEIDRHDRLIDMMVIRALGIVAGDLLLENKDG